MTRTAPWLALLGLMACSDYDLTVHEGTDVWYQNPAEEVDILLVVDNSCSMEPYQDSLGDNFQEFISFFIDANVDYQIGVVTTDVTTAQAGRIRGEIITSETADAAETFAQIVAVGTNGSASEMGLEAAAMALTEPLASGSNAGFLRDDAVLSLIFVSDEEDWSPYPVADYINDFYSIKGFRNRDVMNASSLVIVDEDDCGTYGVDYYGTEGTRYVDVTDQTSGVLGDICASDFSDIVTELSLNASRLRDTFVLSSKPSPASLTLWVDDVELPCEDGGWTYDTVAYEDRDDAPAIVFDAGNLPEIDSQIAVRYNFGDGDPEKFCPDEGER